MVARCRDPAGNVISIYEQPGLTETEARESSAGDTVRAS